MAQKERIDKMTLDQYLQSPQMTAEEILYARQVKFASYTEARKDVFPTFVAELSGWNNIQRLKDGIDPTTGEQANRWFAAGELSLDLASNLLPFLKAGKITQLGKILDATDDVVYSVKVTENIADTTVSLEKVDAAKDVYKPIQGPAKPEMTVPGFEEWLTKGNSDNMVYFGVKDGVPVYTGITKQPIENRLAQHIRGGKDIDELIPLYEGLTRNQARALEQSLIENPLGTSNVLNKINSISPNNVFYDDALSWATKNQ
ncbi:TPA: hypothetical protein U1V77_002006 [Streptococcus suis]|nr:hypothetical protein [Streptococcus suis]